LSEPHHYSIGHDIVSRYEKELLEALPTLYPNEGERTLVEQVLIPQFRLKLEEVFDGFMSSHKYAEGQTIKSSDVPELCKAVTKMIGQFYSLGPDIKGIFAPAYEVIAGQRKRVGKELRNVQGQQFRDILAAHGVTDRKSLLAMGPQWFKKEEFLPYGQGTAFTKAILGRSIKPITTDVLEKIANKLGFTRPDENQQKRDQLSALAVHKITDRQSLLAKTPRWFRYADFAPYGQGAAFAAEVLNTAVIDLRRSHLEQIADKLGFPKPVGLEEKGRQVQILATHGIEDRESLISKGPTWFRETDFPPYGRATAFATAIIGESPGKVNADTLEKIADMLNLPAFKMAEIDSLFDERKTRRYMHILTDHGITDCKSLRNKGSEWFSKTEFPPYGKGVAFAGVILGRTIPKVRAFILDEIADKLGFARIDQGQERQNQVQALADHNITDRDALIENGPRWFTRTEFPPYKKGISFSGVILGRTINKVTIKILEEIADVLFPDNI